LTLADGVVTSGTGLSAISVAANGLVAYRTGGGKERQLTWVDRSGRTLGTLGAPDGADLEFPSISPDGRRVAVTRRVQGNTDIWLMDDARQTRFTFDAGVDQFPVWWPDGSRIVFSSNRTGQADLYQRLASGTAVEERLVASDQSKTPTSVAADGRFLLYYSIDPQTSDDLWIVPLSGDRTPFVFLKTLFREHEVVFSPDGRWVAYMANESGRMEIYVRPFTASPASGAGANEATGQWQISTTGGDDHGEGNHARSGRAGDALSEAHLRQPRRSCAGSGLRCRPGRPLLDQRGRRRGDAADYVVDELASRWE